MIPPACRQLKAETTNTGKKNDLNHLLDPSKVGNEERSIFLSKQLVTSIMNQTIGFGYTTTYGTSHHGVMPFVVPSLDPTTMAQIDITQPAEYWATMIKITDKKNAANRPSLLPELYTKLFTVLQNYQSLLRVLFGINFQHFTQVRDITTTVKKMVNWKNEIINEIQRDNIIWEII